jgi:hypothetical protein
MIYLTCFTSFYGQIYRLLLILLRYWFWAPVAMLIKGNTIFVKVRQL